MCPDGMSLASSNSGKLTAVTTCELWQCVIFRVNLRMPA